MGTYMKRKEHELGYFHGFLMFPKFCKKPSLLSIGLFLIKSQFIFLVRTSDIAFP